MPVHVKYRIVPGGKDRFRIFESVAPNDAMKNGILKIFHTYLFIRFEI